MLRYKTTYFLPFCFFEMDENTKGRKERNERETNKSKEKRPYHPRL